jgi:hypothetical protein
MITLRDPKALATSTNDSVAVSGSPSGDIVAIGSATATSAVKNARLSILASLAASSASCGSKLSPRHICSIRMVPSSTSAPPARVTNSPGPTAA